MYTRNTIPPLHQEEEWYGNGYRKTYLNGIEKLLRQRREECGAKREAFARALPQQRETMHLRYLDMLGWPLNAPPQPVRRVRTNEIGIRDGVRITRVQVEIFPDFWFYGILFVHEDAPALPVAIVQHGGGGTPEMCSSFYNSGNYNDMTLRILRRGVNVFAPQLLLWNDKQFGPSHDRRQVDARLNQLGGSITALEIYCISRCMDWLETQPFASGRFGMAGLSYGGFYSMYAAAADTRIYAALNSCFLTDNHTVCWKDRAWMGASETFMDAEIGALVCPRRLILEAADNDDIFPCHLAEAEYQRMRTYYAEAPGQLSFRMFPGVHEFCPDDVSIETFVKTLQNEQP